ncbi:MAG: sigma-70 family RNA polymerase sigma factor [Vicinamibacteraceae bacterium]
MILDEVVITEILEEAGQHIAERERRFGEIENLYGYALVTVRHVAASRLRHTSMRVEQVALDGDTSYETLSALPSDLSNAEQIERKLLLQQIAARLAPHEKVVFVMKGAGCPSREIADRLEISPAAVDTLFHRAKAKARAMLRAGLHASSTKDVKSPRFDERCRSAAGGTVESADDV